MFNEIIKELRNDSGLTQEALAQEFNISRTTLSKYETGELEPNLDFLKKFADRFNVSVDYLLGRTKISAQSKILHDFDDYPESLANKLGTILTAFKYNRKYIDFVYTMLLAVEKLK